MTKTQVAQKLEVDVEKVLYQARDPEHTMDGRPLPAMTTMLHNICDNDDAKFEEACRLIRLFVTQAFNNSQNAQPKSVDAKPTGDRPH